MLLNESIQFNDLKRIATQTEKTLLKDVNVFDVYAGDKLPKGKKSYALSFILQDEEKTLTERNIEATMQKLIHSFEKELGAEIRGKKPPGINKFVRLGCCPYAIESMF